MLYDDKGQPVQPGREREYAFTRIITGEAAYSVPREFMQKMIAEYSGQLLATAILDPLADVSYGMGVTARQESGTGDLWRRDEIRITVYLRCPMNMEGYRALEQRRTAEHFAQLTQPMSPDEIRAMVDEINQGEYNKLNTETPRKELPSEPS